MRKALLIPLTVCFAITLATGTVFAAASNRLSKATENSFDYFATVGILPVDVIQTPDKLEIRKVYELDPGDSPAQLSREGFERDGYAYEYCDILREAVFTEIQKPMTLTVNAESEKDDFKSILSLFPPSRQEEDEYGYSGILTLNTASIKSEASGYGVSSSPYTITLTYPNLCYMDIDKRSIPTTVYDDNCMLTLQYINWWSGVTAVSGGMDIPVRYTAYAVYNGTKTSSYIKSYAVTAEYTGEAYKSIIDKIRYTVIFSGSPLTEPPPASEQNNEENTIANAEVSLIEERNKMSGKSYHSTILSTIALLVSGVSLFLTLRNQAWKNH